MTMADDRGLFGDDPVMTAVRRDARRQEADAARAERQQREAGIAAVFREQLLAEYDAQVLTICERERELSKSTKAAYAGDMARFEKWCRNPEQPADSVTALGALPEIVARHLHEMRKDGASFAAIKRAFHAISYYHRINNLPDPCGQTDGDGHDVVPQQVLPLAVLHCARAEHQAKQQEQATTNSEGAQP
jgi:hypothetical protein